MVVEPVINEVRTIQAKLQGIVNEIPDIRPEYKNTILTLIKDYDQIVERTLATVVAKENSIKSIDDRVTLVTRQLFANNYELEE